MKKKVAAVAVALLAAFTLAACESQVDVARKGDLVDDIVNNSLSQCKITEPAQRDADYEARLRHVLNGSKSWALDTLLQNKITVCLDSRLPQQDKRFLNARIEGVFYNQDQKVLTLWDNGMIGEGKSMLSRDTGERDAGEYIRQFARAYADGIPQQQEMPYAFATHYGKGGVRWKEQGRFDTDSVAVNPHLLTPPLR